MDGVGLLHDHIAPKTSTEIDRDRHAAFAVVVDPAMVAPLLYPTDAPAS